MPHKEDFAAGTQAAARPARDDGDGDAGHQSTRHHGEMLKARAAMLAETANVDFCLYAGGATHSWEDISSLAEAGVIAYKIFLQPPHPGASMSRRHVLAHPAWCHPLVRAHQGDGSMCVLHAEDEDAVQAGISR
jgi:hypothetical protein